MRGRRETSRCACALVALALLAAPAAAEAQRQRLDVRVLARVGNPGQPEPIAIGPDGRVYVGTNQQSRGDTGAPSKVFAFDPSGRLVREYELQGQKLDEDHGIQGLAFDGSGLLYVLDRSASARVVVLDPQSGAQRDYAALPDVPSCTAAGRSTDCSAANVDRESEPNFAAFAPDGSLYVTDIEQALIWRVPRGGGRADVWFTDSRLESPFGPNGIQLMADRRTLMFAVTGTGALGGTPSTGALFTVPIGPDGRPGQLQEFWRSDPFDGPDGFALSASGNVYLALAAANQLVLISPQGQELQRVPANPVENAGLEVPFDGPASVAFLGQSALVTNQSFPRGDAASWAILDLFAGEPGLALIRPFVRKASLSLRLRRRSRRLRSGRRCAIGRVRATVRGRDRAEARRADFFRGRRRVARDRRPPLSRIVDEGRHRGRSHTHTARARVRMSNGSLVRLKRRYRVCAR